MFALAIACILASAAMCYVVGHAVVAPRDSGLRTKRGMALLIVGGLSIIPLPPQLPGLSSAAAALGAAMPGLELTWPTALPTDTYLTIWLVSSAIGLLVGMRIWKAGRPGWRAGSGTAANDSSASGRAAALIAMANGLDEVFDALRRTSIDTRGVDRIAEELRMAGQRFADSLPEESGAAYRLVTAGVPAPLAGSVTRYLLEGAGRSGQIARVGRG